MKAVFCLTLIIAVTNAQLSLQNLKIATDNGLSSEDDVLQCFKSFDSIQDYAKNVWTDLKQKEWKGKLNHLLSIHSPRSSKSRLSK